MAQANAEGITERLSDQVNSPISKLDVTSFKNIIRVTSKVSIRSLEFSVSVLQQSRR
jgi:hypothetical protein